MTPKANVSKQKPRRSFRAVIDSLRQVWTIERVPDHEAIWRLGQPALAALAPERFRISIWNLCKGAGGLMFEHDYRLLCYCSDILMTQEALLSRHAMSMFCATGFESVHAASYRRRDGLRDGVMTVARVPTCDEPQRIICKYPEPIFKTPKAALIKKYPIAGMDESLLVINIHATLVRRKRAAIEEMQHLLERLPTHRGPMILAGDFNTFTPGYLRAVADVLSQIGLNYVPIPNDPRPTTQALDQLFCRGLEVRSIRVDTSFRNSDHFPILAEMKVLGS
ncbi:MAG: endonuclease/exonuclease/phosphatase family protein [Deltaproteobacteria bacterium]|nr:endonuclease/exonuclease/phosphatase family protein [Deltaproteobacteria bacterium]